MKKLVISSICCSLILLCSGCGAVSELKVNNEAPESQNSAENLSETPISNAFVNAGTQEYIVLHSSSDEDSSAVARMYHGENIDIYELKGQWYRVKYQDISSFVAASAVSFTQPEVAVQNNEAPSQIAPVSGISVENPSSVQTTPAVQNQTPVVNNEVNNTINIVLQYDTDGIALPLSYRDAGYSEYNSGKTAYCSTTSCYIYKTASTSGPRREADMLYQGDPVTVYGDYDGFYYIGTDSGSGYELKGYVQMKYITIGTPPASNKKNYSATQGYVSVGSCNLRSSPSKADDSNVICTLKQGTTFTVNSFDGYWYYINCSSGSGYVSHKMVTVY